MLARAKITCAQLGVGGGARLARPPSEISLLDVYRAVEDPTLFALHRSAPDASSLVGRHIQPALCLATARARQAMEAELAATSIADLVADIRRRDA